MTARLPEMGVAMSEQDDYLRDPMEYDVMREVLNRYRGRCIALADQAPDADSDREWIERARGAQRRANAVDPYSRSAVAAMTAELHQLFTELPDPDAALAHR